MRTHVITAIATLLWVQACDTPSTGVDNGQDGSNPPGAVTAGTEIGVTETPPQVTGLKAVFIAPKVKLTWNRVEGAYGYEIYRDNDNLPSAGPADAPRVPGSRLKMVAANDFNDYDFEFGYRYTYRVVAVNKAGKGPASKPAAVNAVIPLPFLGWLKAPAGPDAIDSPDFDWDNAIGTIGGNQGITTSTSYPGPATQYTSCTGYGAALGAFRPAANTLLPAGQQTFSFDVNYNLTGEAHTYEYYAYATSRATGALIPVYRETGTLTGCGSKIFSFSADFSGLEIQGVTEYLSISDGYWDNIFWRGQGYESETGVWLLLEESVPAVGAMLSGGTISARIRHNKLPRMNAVFQIDTGSYGPIFATAVTAISGSGTFTLNIPYQTVCGYPNGRLRIFGDSDEFYLSKTYAYLLTSSTFSRMLVSNSELWLSPSSANYGIISDLNVSTCTVGTVVPVTIAASTGWQISRYSPATGTQYSTVVTGMTDDYYKLHKLNLPAVSFGTVTGIATATFPSSFTISAVLRAHVFDYFWKVAPPSEAASSVSFPVEVTVAGPRPLNNIYWDSYNGLYGRLEWSELANSYAGSVSFPSCGNWGTFAGSKSPYSNSTNYIETDVTGSVSLETYGSVWFDNGDIGPVQYYLYDSCGQQDFSWSIAYAPDWLLFQSLTGSSNTPLEAALLKDIAFPLGNEYSVLGKIGIQANGAGRIFEINVWASRY